MRGFGLQSICSLSNVMIPHVNYLFEEPSVCHGGVNIEVWNLLCILSVLVMENCLTYWSLQTNDGAWTFITIILLDTYMVNIIIIILFNK